MDIFVGYENNIYSDILFHFANTHINFINLVDKRFLEQRHIDKYLSRYGNMLRSIPKKFKNDESIRIAFMSYPTVSNFEKIPSKYKNIEFYKFAYKLNPYILDYVDTVYHNIIMF